MPRPSRITLTSLATYAVVIGLVFAEKAGQVTSDTKAGLVGDPGALLRSTFSLWNPQESLGDLQNQAYGYLFPMGSFFAGLHALAIPLWVVERLWTVALIVLAWEGTRLVCRQFGLTAWPSWFAGMAYALTPRMLSEIGVRSAEVNPTVVLPWILLPVLLVLRGRISERTGALLAATAFLFCGAVNGTATVAPLPLVLVFVVWGCRRGLARWRLLGWFGVFGVLVSIWWGSALLQLQSYSPPFFDYVEDAPVTTGTAGFDSALRGLSNWVGYLTTGPRPTWPAAWSLGYEPILVLTAGVVAVVGMVGLIRLESRWRTPLLVAAVIGLACITIGHTSQSWVQSPIGPKVQSLLDHPFALLRNVAKIDPVLRLPLAVGLAGALQQLSQFAHGRIRVRISWLATTAVALALMVTAQPLLALNLRTPGWTKLPSYWTQTADYLAAQPGANAAWIVPGSSFALQTWGDTFDEPMSMVARSPWVSRSQVPLVPAASIRMLDSLESLIDTGSGSPRLGPMLARVGIGYVVVRHDLSTGLAEQPTTSLVSMALARSGGLERVRSFGTEGLGPAIEVYKVTTWQPAGDYRITAEDEVATVASGPADVLAAAGLGVIEGLRAAVVDGHPGWDRPAQVVGDGYQLRVRDFGLAHDAEGSVLAPGEPRHATRHVENYPGSPGTRPVVARYDGVAYVDASTSQAFPNAYGPIRAEDAPFSAVDGDQRTSWISGAFTRPRGQYLEIHFPATRAFGSLRIEAPPGVVTTWSVRAGGHSVNAAVDRGTGAATADLGGVRGRTLRITAAAVRSNAEASVAITEVRMDGLPARRRLVLPEVATAPKVDFVFGAAAETRACVPTLLGPDCSADRYRPAAEGSGIDRTFTVDHAGRWHLEGTVVARTTLQPDQLLSPLTGVVMHGSSTYFGDPGVSARMVYDDSATTSWIAATTDRTPTLDITFPKPRTINRISIARPAAPAVAPTRAVIVSGSQRRSVTLNQWGTFAPLRTKHLRITFSNPNAGKAPIGLAELWLRPGKVAQKLDGTAVTGATCGFGPNVYVDGKRRLTAVQGLMGDVVSGGALSLSLCGKPIRLAAGTHRLRVVSTEQFQPTSVVLGQDDLLPALGTPRTLRVLSDAATSRRIAVGPGAASVLEMTGNANPGWRAELDGHQLQPIVVDGWAQGWRIPAGAGGTVHLSFAPQAGYLRWLIGGLVLAGLLVVAAIVAGVRAWRRGTPARPAPAVGRVRRRPLAVRLLLLPAALILFGLPGVVGVALALLLGLRPSLRVPVGAVVMLAGSVVTAVNLHLHPLTGTPDPANLIAGIGAVALLTTGLLVPAEHAGDD